MSDVVSAMVEHYQKTYELTYDLWTQRNRAFLWLLGSVAAATLLTFSPEGGNTLLIALMAKSLDIADSAVPRASISMTVLQGIILLVVFYFMVNLYHLSHQVIRNYQYLGALEQEVRAQLNLGADSVLFTREGTFYWKHRPPLWSCVRWTYIVLLGGLLTTFAGGRFYYDWRTENVLATMVNTTISFFTLCYFLA